MVGNGRSVKLKIDVAATHHQESPSLCYLLQTLQKTHEQQRCKNMLRMRTDEVLAFHNNSMIGNLKEWKLFFFFFKDCKRTPLEGIKRIDQFRWTQNVIKSQSNLFLLPLGQGRRKLLPVNIVQNLWVPMTVSFFARETIWVRIFMLHQLKRRGQILSSRYYKCEGEKQSVDHILLLF